MALFHLTLLGLCAILIIFFTQYISQGNVYRNELVKKLSDLQIIKDPNNFLTTNKHTIEIVSNIKSIEDYLLLT